MPTVRVDKGGATLSEGAISSLLALVKSKWLQTEGTAENAARLCGLIPSYKQPSVAIHQRDHLRAPVYRFMCSTVNRVMSNNTIPLFSLFVRLIIREADLL